MAKQVTRADNRSITSFAVAEAAGVSQSTVSLVMSGKAVGRVSEAKRQHVLETANKLGYSPNASAQMLRTGVMKVIALAVPNVQQPFFGQVLVAAEVAARKRDHSVLLIDTSNDPQWVNRLVGMVRSRLVAGCIVYASDDADERKLRVIKDRILFVEAENSRRSGIDLDIAGAMRDVVAHLVKLSHIRIGYLAARYPKATFRRRYDAFRDQMAMHGLTADPAWRVEATFDLETATAAAKQLLQNRQISALFCDDDLLAAAAYRAARSLNRSIPDDLSVVGFNDIEMARIIHPELTTIAIPAETVASLSVERLLRQLNSKRAVSNETRVVPLKLQIRSSTAPAGTRASLEMT